MSGDEQGSLLKASSAPTWTVMITLYLAMMSVGMGQTVVFAVLPMLGRELGLDQLVFSLPFSGFTFEPREVAITSLSTLTAFTFFVAAPRWGRLSDLWGRKPLIILGLCGYTIGTLVFNGVAYLGLTGALAGGVLYLFLILSRAFHAALMSATHPASSAYMVDVTSVNERTRGMGKMQAFNQIGVMIGPALAWFVHISYLAPFFIQAAITFVVAMMVWRYLPALPRMPRTGVKAVKLSYFDPRYKLYIKLSFTVFCLVGMVQQTLGFYFQDLLQLDGVRSAQTFSMAMVVSSIAMLVAQLGVVQRYVGPPMTLLRFGLPFMGVGYVVLASSNTLPFLLLAMALIGFGMAVTGSSLTASATMAVESGEQGGLAGLLGSTAGLGFMLGPLLGGVLYQFSPAYPYWFAAALVLVIIIILFRHEPVPLSQGK
ncbi:MFS transporter [Zhongshania guokunii]|uniref:MFS transporter n=1 Tax=Zhongshania guokunii TaxID=641783 RepID=A0ABV3UC60_9GAMM